ncbi:uncharacterized protein METZ01_LOCUS491893, partial [marine metagenome]
TKSWNSKTFPVIRRKTSPNQAVSPIFPERKPSAKP